MTEAPSACCCCCASAGAQDADPLALSPEGLLFSGTKKVLCYLCQRSPGWTHLVLSRPSGSPYIHRGPSWTAAEKTRPSRRERQCHSVTRDTHTLVANRGHTGRRRGLMRDGGCHRLSPEGRRVSRPPRPTGCAVTYLRDEQLADAPLQVGHASGLTQDIILEPSENRFFLGVCNLRGRDVPFRMCALRLTRKESVVTANPFLFPFYYRRSQTEAQGKTLSLDDGKHVSKVGFYHDEALTAVRGRTSASSSLQPRKLDDLLDYMKCQ